jgi:large subunit ribosomal protein L34
MLARDLVTIHSSFYYQIPEDFMPKRTYQPKSRKRLRVHGFMKRMSSKAGQAVMKRRRLKGRAKISA